MSYEAEYFVSETDGIEITAIPVYLSERSDPVNNKYYWAYHITIENNSDEEIQVISRDLNIIGENGEKLVDAGIGFDCEQPILEPGECFEYETDTIIYSPSAHITGSYKIYSTEDKYKEIKIPSFMIESGRDLSVSEDYLLN